MTAGSRYVALRPGAPHRHDARIERLYSELRRLIWERRCDRTRALAKKRAPVSAATRAKMAAAHRRRYEQHGFPPGFHHAAGNAAKAAKRARMS